MSFALCRLGALLALGLGVGIAAAPAKVSAGPNSGEARSILRDGERVYEVVAGEADGAATVTNPANLGFLRGVNGVLDFGWTPVEARRRGSAVGALVGIPLPFRIAAIGLAYQFLYPVQPEDGGGESESPQNPDEPFSKFTLALAIPFERWVRGLSVGINYSRLVSGRNFHASGVNQTDLGISYWPTRFVALGVVARAMNVPDTGPDGIQPVAQPFVLDPEVAVRPLGTPWFEFALGLRWASRVPNFVRFRTFNVEPRGRLMVGRGAVRGFATVERFRYFPAEVSTGAEFQDAVRIGAGLEVNFAHVGLASGILASAGGRRPFAADGAVARLRISQERYEGITFAPRRVTRLQLSNYGGDADLWRLIGEIEEIARRRGVVLIETRGMRFGWAQIEELRAALLALRQHGGEVYAYLEGGSLRHYFMATAADKVLAHPTNSLSILGMRIQAFFFAELLAKLGAKAEFVRIAEYKSYPETLERNTASPPTASQRKLLVSDIWNHVLRRIARDRGHEPRVIKEWIDAAPLHPPRAIRDGVIDALAYPDQIDEKLEEWLGRKVRIQKPSKQREHEHLYGPPPRIAVLLIEGDILDSESFEIPILGRKVAGSYTLTREIERLREDDGVRAVVVRIDSPGGSVTASEAIARELDLTRAEKPVVISMGNACASGGYYIATGGQYVFADATTVTGSIGIFYPKVDLSGTLEMFGVHVDAFNFGRRAGLRSWFKPYSEDEWAAALGAIEDDYAVFVERVARARSMTLARVDNVARGRVWSGVRALEIGLVDQYGGLSDAIGRARAIAGLQPREAEVVLYPKKPGLIENLRRIFEIDLPLPIGEAEVGRAAFSELRPGSLGIPSPILLVLRHLPIPLWWSPGPQPLALAEETLVLAD